MSRNHHSFGELGLPSDWSGCLYPTLLRNLSTDFWRVTVTSADNTSAPQSSCKGSQECTLQIPSLEMNFTGWKWHLASPFPTFNVSRCTKDLPCHDQGRKGIHYNFPKPQDHSIPGQALKHCCNLTFPFPPLVHIEMILISHIWVPKKKVTKYQKKTHLNMYE